MSSKLKGGSHTKTDEVVAVSEAEVVTIRRTTVPGVVAPATATQHAVKTIVNVYWVLFKLSYIFLENSVNLCVFSVVLCVIFFFCVTELHRVGTELPGEFYATI